jgi:hypothetical protein
LHGGDGLSELLLDEMLHRFSGLAFAAGARVRDCLGGCRKSCADCGGNGSCTMVSVGFGREIVCGSEEW